MDRRERGRFGFEDRDTFARGYVYSRGANDEEGGTKELLL